MKFSKSWTVFALLAAIHFCLYPHLSIAQWGEVVVNGTRVSTPVNPIMAMRIYNALPGQVLGVGNDGGVIGLTGPGICALVKGVVYVTDCGAIGNGVTDDSAAIALAVSKAAITGGVVFYPPGNYLANTMQNAPPGNRAILYFSGLTNVTFAGAGSASHLYSTTLNKSTLEVINSSNITVRDMRIDAQNGIYVENFGYGGGSAIKMSGVSGCEVTNVEVAGAASEAIYLTNGTSNCHVHHNYIHDLDGAGVGEDACGALSGTSCGATVGPSGNHIDHNVIRDAARKWLSAILLDDNSSQVHTKVDYNHISWTSASIGASGSTGPQQGIHATNALFFDISYNTVIQARAEGIVATNATTGSISHNWIIGAVNSGIDVYSDGVAPVSSVSISNNTVLSSGLQCIAITASATPPSGLLSDIIISGNQCTGDGYVSPGTYNAIDVFYGSNITIAGNVVDGSSTITKNAVHIGSTVTGTVASANVSANLAAGGVAYFDESGVTPNIAPLVDANIPSGVACYQYPCEVARLPFTYYSGTTSTASVTLLSAAQVPASRSYRMCGYLEQGVAPSAEGSQVLSLSYKHYGYAAANNISLSSTTSGADANGCTQFQQDASSALTAYLFLSGVTGSPTYGYWVTVELLKP